MPASKKQKLQGNSSGFEKKLDIITNLLKDLLILELGKAGFNRKTIRGVLGRIDNSRINRVLTTIKKAENLKNNQKK